MFVLDENSVMCCSCAAQHGCRLWLARGRGGRVPAEPPAKRSILSCGAAVPRRGTFGIPQRDWFNYVKSLIIVQQCWGGKCSRGAVGMCVTHRRVCGP